MLNLHHSFHPDGSKLQDFAHFLSNLKDGGEAPGLETGARLRGLLERGGLPPPTSPAESERGRAAAC